jgi:hypothetical protein
VAEPTDDVAATKAWLGTSGFVLVEQSGGPQAPFGDVVWTYERGDGIGLRIGSDRGQWALEVRAIDAETWYDFAYALMARGIDLPNTAAERNPYEVVQLPNGVDWREHLPATIDWLTGAHATAGLLESARAAAVSALRGILPSPLPREAAARRDETVRDYFRQQHAKGHPPNWES